MNLKGAPGGPLPPPGGEHLDEAKFGTPRAGTAPVSMLSQSAGLAVGQVRQDNPSTTQKKNRRGGRQSLETFQGESVVRPRR